MNYQLIHGDRILHTAMKLINAKIPSFVLSKSYLVRYCLFEEGIKEVLSDDDVFLDGVHHYDEYGLKNIFDEPPEIRKIHEEMIAFVNSWLKDWNVEHGIGEE